MKILVSQPIKVERYMAETLGMLCDKLTIVKLKEYHTEEPARLQSLYQQAEQLQSEIPLTSNFHS